MTDEQLREAVAAIIRRGAIYIQTSEEFADVVIARMRTVIRAQALEEAARVAIETGMKHAKRWPMESNITDTAHHIAAAIRALKEKP